jgi:hypothetical protein
VAQVPTTIFKPLIHTNVKNHPTLPLVSLLVPALNRKKDKREEMALLEDVQWYTSGRPPLSAYHKLLAVPDWVMNGESTSNNALVGAEIISYMTFSHCPPRSLLSHALTRCYLDICKAGDGADWIATFIRFVHLPSNSLHFYPTNTTFD